MKKYLCEKCEWALTGKIMESGICPQCGDRIYDYNTGKTLPMTTIHVKINSTKLAAEILANTDKIGSTDWDIYVDKNGRLDCRHSTNSMDGWYEIIDLYSFWGDDETINSTPDELGYWLKSDGIACFEDFYTWDESEKIIIEWEA